jgi:hypothetical protein
VFTGKRSKVGGFFRGTLHDPDPVLVITEDAAVEYVSSKSPLAAVHFGQLDGVRLRGNATTMSDSMHADLHIWLDLRYRDGSKAKWQPAAFRDRLDVVQSFIEAHAVYRARGAASGWR